MMPAPSRLTLWLALLLAMLLSGCAGTIVRSEVTAFHEPAVDFGDKTYRFDRDASSAADWVFVRPQPLPLSPKPRTLSEAHA